MLERVVALNQAGKALTTEPVRPGIQALIDTAC